MMRRQSLGLVVALTATIAGSSSLTEPIESDRPADAGRAQATPMPGLSCVDDATDQRPILIRTRRNPTRGVAAGRAVAQHTADSGYVMAISDGGDWDPDAMQLQGSGHVIDIMILMTRSASDEFWTNQDLMDDHGTPPDMAQKAVYLFKRALFLDGLLHAPEGIDVRLVHFAVLDSADDDESGSAFDDLEQLVNEGMIEGVDYSKWDDITGPGGLQEQYGADLVHLIVGPVEDFAGAAVTLRDDARYGTNTHGQGYSLSRIDATIGQYTFLHEISHNLGAGHATCDESEMPCGFFSFSKAGSLDWACSEPWCPDTVMTIMGVGSEDPDEPIGRVHVHSGPDGEWLGWGPTGDADHDNISTIRATARMVVDYSCSTVCPADVDQDNVVGFEDLLIILGNWGESPSHPCADLAGTPEVGFLELLAVLGSWGEC